MFSERGEQDVESETHSNAEENHNTDMDEEHDVEVDVDENAKKVLKEDEAGDEAESTQAKDEVLDKTPVVVLTADPTVDAEAVLKVKGEPEEGARTQVEVRVYGHEMWSLVKGKAIPVTGLGGP
jgi:biopolymer transport protein ExbD